MRNDRFISGVAAAVEEFIKREFASELAGIESLSFTEQAATYARILKKLCTQKESTDATKKAAI